MSKVLVIGKNSYIAKNLLHLTKEWNVKNQYDAVSASSGEWETYSFETYDTVIMLAAIVHKKETDENRKLYQEVNVDLTFKIARKAKMEGVKQFIFMSTIAVYGNKITEITDNTVLYPVTEYAKTKKTAEELLMRLEERGFRIAIVRPPMVYGKNAPGNFAKLEKLIRSVHVFPKTYNKRSVIYIENLCKFLDLLVENMNSGIFHPQDDEYLCTSEIAEALRKKNGRKSIIIIPIKPVILLGCKCSKYVNKIFGSLYCSQTLSMHEEMDYIIVPHKNAIEKSVGTNL